jgi:hypothetical protein
VWDFGVYTAFWKREMLYDARFCLHSLDGGVGYITFHSVRYSKVYHSVQSFKGSLV